MRRDQRLRRAADFAGVYHRGRAWSHPMVVIKALPNRMPVTRFGFAVGKKLGNAVVRNRVKRRLREIVRGLPVRVGWDIIVIAKVPAVAAEFVALRAAVHETIRRAKLLAPGLAAVPAAAGAASVRPMSSAALPTREAGP